MVLPCLLLRSGGPHLVTKLPRVANVKREEGHEMLSPSCPYSRFTTGNTRLFCNKHHLRRFWNRPINIIYHTFFMFRMLQLYASRFSIATTTLNSSANLQNTIGNHEIQEIPLGTTWTGCHSPTPPMQKPIELMRNRLQLPGRNWSNRRNLKGKNTAVLHTTG